MKNQRQLELSIYKFIDWLSAALSWLLFFYFRRKLEQSEISFSEVLSSEKLHLGLLIIPLCWVIFYSVFDKYTDIYRYSRLATLRRTFTLTFIGCLFLFFTVMLDDLTYQYTHYLYPFFILAGLHFLITGTARILLLTYAKWRLAKGVAFYNTLLIADKQSALELHNELQKSDVLLGHRYVGYVSDSIPNKGDNSTLAYLGKLGSLSNIIEDNGVEDVVIGLKSPSQKSLSRILQNLYEYRDTLIIKVVPGLYDILLGKVKMNHLASVGLIEIDQEIMSSAERFVKRAFDVVASLILILICLPLFIYVAIRVKCSSPGSLLFRQERIGKDGIPFTILKFRSMYIDAEKAGPQLSSDNDPRITPFGRIMRKWRLDEIPQFFNLLIGDMSLVGPRPERQHFIDKILEREPLYGHLLKVRPGITSWGQVRFGYASDIDQMLQRMKYDLNYLESMSLSLDIKILFQTALVLIQGKGK